MSSSHFGGGLGSLLEENQFDEWLTARSNEVIQFVIDTSTHVM